MGPFTVLDQSPDNADSSSFDEALKFVQSMFPAKVSTGVGNGNQDRRAVTGFQIVADRFCQRIGLSTEKQIVNELARYPLARASSRW